MSDCIFCKIACGDIPCAKVLETPDCVAFLDIAPLAPGHTLLIPRQHIADITSAPPEMVTSLALELPRLAHAVIQSSGASGLNILQNTGASSGQAVFHLHIHLIPRREGDSLGFRWNAGSYGTGEGEAMRQRIVTALSSSI
ncbi:MAG: HIT family protein [Planctomycetota bacterium]